jgi:Ca-activated chloride channel family protein
MPADGLGASVRLDHQLLAVEREHRVHCLLELTAPPNPTDRQRRPLHLALVIDRSCSMGGDKLETAKACAAYLARRLAPTDRLAVVTYDDEVRLELPLTDVGHDQLRLERALQGIRPGGSTNLSGGWLKGVEQLRAVPGGTGPKKVLLLTDGLANRGVTDPSALVAMARGACDDGVGTTTIGFGQDFDEELLTAIADVAAGNAYFAATPEEAPAIFAQEFEGLTALVAQNLSVEVRSGPDVQMIGLLNEYPIVPVAGGLQAQLGDAYAEERRRVVFELAVPKLETLGVVTVAEVVVRYVSLGERIEAHELRLPVTVNAVSAAEAAAAGPDAGVVEEIVVLKSARAQREAREHAERGEFDSARKLLTEAVEDLRRVAPGSSGAEELLTQAEETARFAESMSDALYDETTKKHLRYSEWQRNRGRPRRQSGA